MSDVTVDAWEQFENLAAKFTLEMNPRQDLRVEGLAWDRTVRLTIKGARLDDSDPLSPRRLTFAQRNVGTMRELAHALLAACDFVEAANPEWASHLDHPVPYPPAASERNRT